MSADAVTLVACASAVVFVVITNLMMMLWQDYHHLNESDQTVLFIGSVIFGVIAFLLNLVCLVSISNSLLKFLALIFANVGLIVFFQLIVLAAIENAKINYLSDDRSKDKEHEKHLLISKTVNELLLMTTKRGDK